MVVGVLEVSFRLPDSGSLKDKRHVVRSLKDRIRNRYNVSVAETEGHQTWRTCTLAFAAVAGQQAVIERDFEMIISLIESRPEIAHIEAWTDYF